MGNSDTQAQPTLRAGMVNSDTQTVDEITAAAAVETPTGTTRVEPPTQLDADPLPPVASVTDVTFTCGTTRGASGMPMEWVIQGCCNL